MIFFFTNSKVLVYDLAEGFVWKSHVHKTQFDHKRVISYSAKKQKNIHLMNVVN